MIADVIQQGQPDYKSTMLDVHIADSFDAATRNEPIIRIDLDVYTAFFSDRIDLTETCPTLQRMNDYFSDCTFA